MSVVVSVAKVAIVAVARLVYGLVGGLRGQTAPKKARAHQPPRRG